VASPHRGWVGVGNPSPTLPCFAGEGAPSQPRRPETSILQKKPPGSTLRSESGASRRGEGRGESSRRAATRPPTRPSPGAVPSNTRTRVPRRPEPPDWRTAAALDTAADRPHSVVKEQHQRRGRSGQNQTVVKDARSHPPPTKRETSSQEGRMSSGLCALFPRRFRRDPGERLRLCSRRGDPGMRSAPSASR